VISSSAKNRLAGIVQIVLGKFLIVGLLVGTLFLAFSLTPSLLLRTYVFQGIISGVSLAAGYGVGVFGRWLWFYMELPIPGGRVQRVVTFVAAVLCALVAAIFLWQASEWQDSIRLLMGMERTEGVRPLRVAIIALPLFVALLMGRSARGRRGRLRT